MDNISISLSDSGKTSHVRIDGVIDTNTAGELEEVIDSLLKRSRYQILIDLSGVDYVSSAGWGIFISHIRDVRNNGGDIVLAGMIPNVYEIYELLEFDNVLKAFDSTDEARAVFGESGGAAPTKKKEPMSEHLTVIDAPTAPIAQAPSHGFDAPRDAESLMLQVICDDPFLTISELKQEICQAAEMDGISWFSVFKMLRARKLLKRRSRFRFARLHRNS